MIKGNILIITVLLVIAFIYYQFITGNNNRSGSVPERSIEGISKQRHVELGVWTEGLFDPKERTLHPEKLLQFEQMVNKKVAIAHYYRGWESLTDPKLVTEFEQLRKNGWKPMLNVNPYYFPQCPATDLPLYKAIAEGKCDDFLHKAGQNLRKVKQPLYFLFAWEMNNEQNDWSISKSGSSPEDFIKAWRHIHAIFKKEKAGNVHWVFCPNIPDVSYAAYDKIYPGDDVVDWLGLDGYNWGTTQSWSQWTSFEGVFRGSYDRLTRIAPDKPLMLAEVNTTDQGGDKAAWYADMLQKQIPDNFPKISAVIFFNEDRTVQEHVNWKIDSSQESLQAFITGIQFKLY